VNSDEERADPVPRTMICFLNKTCRFCQCHILVEYKTKQSKSGISFGLDYGTNDPLELGV
jgi:hypothetical protein